MRLALPCFAACAATLIACSQSRRSVRQAPGAPARFQTRPPEDARLLKPTRHDPDLACRPGSAACRTLIHAWSFVPEALQLCRAESQPDDRQTCMAHAAGRRFSAVALEACGALDAPQHRVGCLDAVADRALEPPQLAACSDLPDKKVNRCLRRMHDFRFNPKELHQLVRNAIDRTPTPNTGPRILAVEDAFEQRYQLDRSQWPAHYVFNFAGGATTHIRAMYCALDEYVLIVGSPLNVNGYSGRYPAEVHDFVFAGLMHDFEEHDFNAHDFEPGSWAFLPHGDHRVYATETPTYMVEYARGWIPGMLSFGIRHPRRAITRDRKNMKQQIRMCARRALATSKARRRATRRRRAEQRETQRAVRRALRGARGEAARQPQPPVPNDPIPPVELGARFGVRVDASHG